MKFTDCLLVVAIAFIMAVALNIVFTVRYTDAWMKDEKAGLIEQIDSVRYEVNEVKERLDSLCGVTVSDRGRLNQELRVISARFEEMDNKIEEFDKDLYAFD